MAEDQAATPCRFRVVRTGDPLAPYPDKLDQRFNGGQATG